jgi:hypothetical protein
LPAAATTTAPWSTAFRSAVVEHLDRHDLRARRDARDAHAVALVRRDDSGDVGAVALAVLRVVVTAHQVAALREPALEVRMTGLDPRVDHRHHRALARRDRVRGVGLDHVQVPLLGAQGIAGRAGRRGAGEHDCACRSGDG